MWLSRAWRMFCCHRSCRTRVFVCVLGCLGFHYALAFTATYGVASLIKYNATEGVAVVMMGFVWLSAGKTVELPKTFFSIFD